MGKKESRKVYIYYKIWNKHHPNDKIEHGDKYVIHHIDGDYTNNNIDNLQKMLDIDHRRTHTRGDNNPMRKYPKF